MDPPSQPLKESASHVPALILDFSPPDCEGSIPVVLSHPWCGPLIGLPQDTHPVTWEACPSSGLGFWGRQSWQTLHFSGNDDDIEGSGWGVAS